MSISGNVVSMRTVAGILHGEFKCQGYYIPSLEISAFMAFEV